jgi:NADPH-dependent 2,4-dienoyl-CoA reductase/sulfur reductase-like enzyme
MILISDMVLRNSYDVIVVGAGLGGMAAASLLAKRGLSVLMIDQQNKPGEPAHPLNARFMSLMWGLRCCLGLVKRDSSRFASCSMS